MKRKLLSALLLTLLLSPLSIARSQDKNSERRHYKCHLLLADKSEVIHGFVSGAETQSEFEAGLPGRMVYAADGVTGSTIATLYQCVQAGQNFRSKRARELQEKTPF